MALVCSAPNLTTLHLSVDNNWGNTDFLLNKLDHGQIIGPKFTLPFLTTLYVDHPKNTLSRACRITDLDGLLHSAPNLATLRINCGYSMGTLTARLPQLTELHLRNANVTAEDLKALVGTSTRLAEVILTHGERHDLYLPVSPQRALDALVPSRFSLRRLALHTWTPEDGCTIKYYHPWLHLEPHDTFPLLDGVRLAELFPVLEQLSLDARAVTGLPDLLAGMERLEGLTLVNVRASEQLEEEMQTMLRRVLMSEWPRLRSVKMWSYRSANPRGPQTVWEELRGMLERLGWRKVNERGEVGAVVAGVSFLAVSKKLKKMKIFADLRMDSDE
jgi:hypothetical protein